MVVVSLHVLAGCPLSVFASPIVMDAGSFRVGEAELRGFF